MPSSTCLTQLRDLADQRADALDRLIFSDYQEYIDTPDALVILEDHTFALTLWTLAELIEQLDDAEADKPGSVVLARQRSYAAARDLYALLAEQVPQALPYLRVAGLDTDGNIDYSTLSLADFLDSHSFAGNSAIGRLPKSHGALADWSADFASVAGNTATILLGGNTKHMNKTFNETLSRSFAQVQGLRGKGKHRCLLASVGKSASVSRHQSELLGFGGVFSGAKADRGGELLAATALEVLPHLGTELNLVDFGCGNGSVSRTVLGGVQPETLVRVTATDIDADAVRSASANLSAFDRVEIMWDDAAAAIASDSVDVVLLNPPFHDGTRIDLTMVQPMLDAAARILVPGGTLFLVHNSHARYRSEVKKRFSRVEQVRRNETFTVLKAQK